MLGRTATNAAPATDADYRAAGRELLKQWDALAGDAPALRWRVYDIVTQFLDEDEGRPAHAERCRLSDALQILVDRLERSAHERLAVRIELSETCNGAESVLVTLT
jgi:hypothetical protein